MLDPGNARHPDKTLSKRQSRQTHSWPTDTEWQALNLADARYRNFQTSAALSLPALNIYMEPAAAGASWQILQTISGSLTDLFHETDTLHNGAYLDWPRQQRETYNARYTASIYALSSAGEALLEDEDVQVNYLTDLVRSGRMAVNREFAHTMMICDTLASIELGVQSEPNVRLVSWQEILAKAPKETQQAGNPFAIS